MKTNLFNRVRNLFRRAEPEYDYDEYYEEDYSDVMVEEPVAQDPSGDDETSADDPTRQASRRSPGDGAPARPAGPEERGVYVPLAPIVAGMPLGLQSRLLHDVGDLSVFLSLDTILPQLSKGAVSLSFGELRKAAPDVFNGDRDQDAAEIEVPLSAVLPHISPDMLARKHGPLQMEIPDDIVSPFADKGRGLAIAAAQQTRAASPSPQEPSGPVPVPQVSKPQRAQTPSAPQISMPPPAQPSRPISMSRPLAAQRPAVSLPGPGGNAPTATSAPTVPPPNAAASVTAKGTQIIPRPDVAKTPVVPKAPVPMPATSVAPSAPSAVHAPPATAPSVPSASAPAPSVPSAVHAPSVPITPVAPAASRSDGPPLVVALSSVADAWPDSLKQEIIQLGLAEAELAVPYAVVEAGLKRGHLRFPWVKVRAWINPAPQITASVHDSAELELPLRVIAPLFVARKKAQPDKTTKVAVDKDIPNLFFGLPQPDTTGVAVDHSVNKPVDTNYYVWSDDADVVPDDHGGAAAAHAPTAGTAFVTRYATPNEVVSRAEALDGVEGALVALPDGLMVASQLPAGINGDTLAAFLPQLFSKVTQCTQELRMGEVNNLNFTVGNVPWKIFRVNALYFAAFGAKGESMPTARLAALAGELDHKAKV